MANGKWCVIASLFLLCMSFTPPHYAFFGGHFFSCKWQGKKKKTKTFTHRSIFVFLWQPSVRELTYFELHPFIFIRPALPSHAVILLSYGWTQTHRECHRVFTAISELDSFRSLHNMWGLCRSEMEPERSHQALNALNSPGQAALLRLPPRSAPCHRSADAALGGEAPRLSPLAPHRRLSQSGADFWQR